MSVLDAGGILPGPATDPGLDTITARSYRHPVLAGRTVVRLTGAAVGPAEDLSMEFLGFSGAGSAEVGHGRRGSLGFPAWALVHDPANGRYALAMVKDMERLARTARHKPGNAKDGYTELADRLGRAAPQLLPVFWEQAGRAFLAAGNQRMAGTCFAEARRAEQVHGLPVDEDRVRDVHLEFALAGGLTAAMLAAYAREVAARRPPGEAYELVKGLSLRRVAGGQPPHAALVTDLARLARAAGLDADRESGEVVTLLLTYPATLRSHPSLWKSLRKVLIRVGKQDAAVRARLLEILPDPPGWRTDMRDQWLELLEATGAAADLTAGTSGVAAGHWLDRFLETRRYHHNGDQRNARLLALVERMAPRLIAEGGARLAPDPSRADLDILDVCVAAGVPVDIGADGSASGFDVAQWVADTGDGRRDLAAIAADPRLRPRLRQGVRRLLGKFHDGKRTTAALPGTAVRETFGAAGVRDVLLDLIGLLTAPSGTETVTGLAEDLAELAPLWSPAGMALFPEAFRRLPSVDVPAVVARTLRAGLLAELSWPAYESAFAALGRVECGVAWPELLLHDERSARLISPDGAVTEHVFRLPAAGDRLAPQRWSPDIRCLHADGELLVWWRTEDGQAGYWSSRPGEPAEGEWQFHPAQGEWHPPLPVPGGGLTTGQEPVHPGDTRAVTPQASALAGDGQAYWRWEPVDPGLRVWQQRYHWREFDPRTGAGGRVSMPPFLAAAGDALEPDGSWVRPVPDGFAGSPLGSRDGLAGWRLTRQPDGTVTGEGVDGRVAVPPRGRHRRSGEEVIGALSLPGAAAPLAMTRLNRTVRLWTADSGQLLAEHVPTSGTVPPLAWWHLMRPRDQAGSLALRNVDDTIAAALLTVGDAVTGTAALTEAVTANVLAHLPAVTDATLRDRVVAVAVRAVELRRRIAEVTAHLDRHPEQTREVPPVSDDALTTAWSGLAGPDHGRAGDAPVLLEQMAAVGAILADPDTAEPGRIPPVGAVWAPLLAGLGAVALRAASPVTPEADRTALAAMLATVAGTPLDGGGAPVRVLEVAQDSMVTVPVRGLRDGARLTLLLPAQGYEYDGSRWLRGAIQLAPDGDFAPLTGLAVHQELRPSGRLAGERLRAYLALLADRGPAPWRPEAAEALAAATGMTGGEAVLLLAGLPGIDRWEAAFLSAEQRRLLGLTAPHAKTARSSVTELSHAQRVELLDAAMPTDPAGLWERGPDVAAIAERWIAIRGRRAAVPDDLVTGLARLVDQPPAAGLLQTIAAPNPGDWLTTDGVFDEEHLRAVATALPWLAYHLTWGDPLRATLPEALRLVRERLRDPNLRVGDAWYQVEHRPDAGPALVDEYHHGSHVRVSLAPAHLTGRDDPVIGLVDDDTSTALRITLSGLIEHAVATPDGVAGDPRDPRVSLPVLVDEVRERHGLDAGAAAYYLQLLALPDPTDTAVRAWNGWTPPELRAAQRALTEAGLVVAAKRERAGRPVFLPGGWQTARPPHLPVETWKAGMFGGTGGARLVLTSLPRQFGMAWARILDGDVPRYHDLEETR